MNSKFWQEVAVAYEQVNINNDLSITVERENKQALVKCVKGVVLIMIGDGEEAPPTLIVPPGQGAGDD